MMPSQTATVTKGRNSAKHQASNSPSATSLTARSTMLADTASASRPDTPFLRPVSAARFRRSPADPASPGLLSHPRKDRPTRLGRWQGWRLIARPAAANRSVDDQPEREGRVGAAGHDAVLPGSDGDVG